MFMSYSVNRSIIILIALIWALIFSSAAAFGESSLKSRYKVGRVTPVYSGPDKEWITDKKFTKGQIVLVSEDCDEGFCAVNELNGAEIGFAPRTALIDWQWLESVGERPKKWRVEFSVLESFIIQNPHLIQTSLNSNYNVSTFRGQNTNFSIGVDYKKDANWHWQGGFIYRHADTEGDSVEVGTGLTNRFRLEQVFYGVNGALMYHLSRNDNFSFGGYVEYSKGQSVDLKVVSGPPINSTGLGRPLYVIIEGVIAYTREIRKNHYLSLVGRGGLITTTNPQSFIGEAVGAYGLAF